MLTRNIWLTFKNIPPGHNYLEWWMEQVKLQAAHALLSSSQGSSEPIQGPTVDWGCESSSQVSTLPKLMIRLSRLSSSLSSMLARISLIVSTSSHADRIVTFDTVTSSSHSSEQCMCRGETSNSSKCSHQSIGQGGKVPPSANSWAMVMNS